MKTMVLASFITAGLLFLFLIIREIRLSDENVSSFQNSVLISNYIDCRDYLADEQLDEDAQWFQYKECVNETFTK